MDLLLTLNSIHNEVKSKVQSESNVGVLNGLGGSILFFEYYKKFIPNKNDYSLEEILNIGIEKINKTNQLYTFCDGINGFAWSILHLQKNNFLKNLDSDFLENFDECIMEWLILTVQKDNYDFMHGSSGAVLYLIDRYEYLDKNIKQKIEKLITSYVEKVEKHLKNIINLNNSNDFSDSTVRIYLGLAHGISGIAYILTKIFKKINNNDNILKLIKQYCDLIFSLSIKDKISLFPSWLSHSSNSIMKNSALSWCTGDLGIGIALLNISQDIEDNDIKNNAMMILEHSAKRTSKENSLINSPCLCHGYFGAYKIFSRAYNITKEDNFLIAKKHWLNIGLESINNNKMDTTILNGLAGVGLCLIDEVMNFDNNWGECLLLS